jgi:hypothetical protein
MQWSFIDHKRAIMHKKTAMGDLFDLIEVHLRKGSVTLQNTADYIGTPEKTREEIQIGIRNHIYACGGFKILICHFFIKRREIAVFRGRLSLLGCRDNYIVRNDRKGHQINWCPPTFLTQLLPDLGDTLTNKPADRLIIRKSTQNRKKLA